MAVIASAKDSVLVVTFETGVTPQGSAKLSQRSFPNVKLIATDEDIYNIAVAIYELQGYPLRGVRRDNRVDLASD
ncbi:DUF1659 domain-containing protein [Desulfosporosinus fructosivorans]